MRASLAFAALLCLASTIVWAQSPVAKLPSIEQTNLRFVQVPTRVEHDQALQSEPVPLGQPAASPCVRLGLADLEAIALANNPTLAQAAAQVSAARGRWTQAGLYPNPTIGYLASEIGNEGKGGQQGGFVGQEFVTAGKLSLNRAVVSQEIVQAQQQFDMQRFRVLSDVRTQFYAVLAAQRTLELTHDLVEIAERALRTAEELLRAQEASRVDLLQARVEMNSAKIALKNAGNRHASAWRTLVAVAGVPQVPPTPLLGDLEAGLHELSWEGALSGLLVSSPELAAARAGVDRARLALRRATVEPIPNVDVQASVQYDNASTDTIASLQVGIPVPLLNRNQGNIRQAQAQLTAAQAEIARIELELQQRLASAFERYANARNQVAMYSKEILPDARSSLDLVSAGYRAGQFNFLTLLTAQRTYSQANLAYISSLAALWESTVEIEALLLSGSLRSNSAPSNPSLGGG